MRGLKVYSLVVAILIALVTTSLVLADESSELTHNDLLGIIRDLEARIENLESKIEALQAEVDRLNDNEVSPESEGAESTAPKSSTNDSTRASSWESFARGWEYRNGTYSNIGFGTYQFLVEVRRVGGSIEMAMFTVTLYDSSGAIVATGSGFAMDMQRGDSKTVQFLLQGNPSSASSFRLQVDTEM